MIKAAEAINMYWYIVVPVSVKIYSNYVSLVRLNTEPSDPYTGQPMYEVPRVFFYHGNLVRGKGGIFCK